MSVSATAKALGVGWELVNQVAVDACRSLVYDNASHLDGVRIPGVDEHVWKHTRRPGQPSSFVTVVVDLTPLVDGTGPARLLALHCYPTGTGVDGIADEAYPFLKCEDGSPVLEPDQE